jgi:hypothetical protein
MTSPPSTPAAPAIQRVLAAARPARDRLRWGSEVSRAALPGDRKPLLIAGAGVSSRTKPPQPQQLVESAELFRTVRRLRQRRTRSETAHDAPQGGMQDLGRVIGVAVIEPLRSSLAGTGVPLTPGRARCGPLLIASLALASCLGSPLWRRWRCAGCPHPLVVVLTPAEQLRQPRWLLDEITCGRAINQGDKGAATATTGRQPWQVSATDSRIRSASQADSASSILVTRFSP